MQYRQLLLSTGGGIVSSSQMDVQSNCATIAIGLGGTGVACLRNFKRQVYSRLQPDDPKAVIPSYSHIKFLAVDTDRSSLESDGQMYDLNEATEFFDISSGNIQNLLQQTAVLAGKPECEWLKNKDDELGQGGLSILSATAGAGGVRQIGRLLIVEKSRAFVDLVGQLINDAKAGLPGGSDVNIHIFSGMGGGTGSGTFMDVCYLVQKALREVGEDGHALTCGYFFLPDVNLNVPAVAADSTVSNYIKANGFAAMKELDYCMNFHNNHGKWDQEYRTFHVETQETPVKLCHLISATTTSGSVLQDGFTYAMNVVTNYVMQFVVESNGFTLNSHIANFFKKVESLKKEHGGNYSYCILGASNAVVPMREITTYLASKLFEGMAKVRDQVPTNAEIEAFAKENGLNFQGLFRSILDKTSYQMPALQLDFKLYTSMPEDDLALPEEVHLPETILGSYRQVEQKLVGRVESNKQALLHEWRKENIREDHDSISKMCRVYYALSDVVGDASKGPLYAAAILKGTGRTNLVDLLKGVLKETQDAIAKANMDTSLRVSTIKNARTAFLHPGLRSKAKLFDAFMQTVQQYMTNSCKIKVLEEMESMLRTMIDQMERLYEEHFKVYAYVTQNLIDTFHENYRYLTNRAKPVNNPFVMPLMTIEDLQDSLDKTVASMNLDSELSSFHAKIFADHNVWLGGDENKISKAVSSYLTDRFSGYTNKTLTDYLEIRFNTTDPQTLANEIYRQILMPLSDKATPLFSLSNAFLITDAAPLGYCSIPDGATAIKSAAGTLLGARPDLSLVPNKVPDRISMLRCTCGVPMFGYNGVETYYPVYDGDTSVGKHIYENTTRDPRDWRNLPNLRPFSTINRPDEETRKAGEDYDKAVEMDIVRVSPTNKNDYHIVVNPDLDELKHQVQAAVESGDITALKTADKALADFRATRRHVRLIAVTNDGADGHKEKVRKDHVVASRDMMNVIRGELAKEAALEQMAKDLAAAMEQVAVGAKVREEFFNAMMCGVFTYKIPTVTYKREVLGMSEDMVLSEPKMEPYGKVVPLYQAYLSFKAMSEEDRAEVVNTTDERMSMLDPALKEACTNLVTVFNPQYMGMMQRMLQRAVTEPATVKKIQDFLKEFRMGVDDFMGMYGLL